MEKKKIIEHVVFSAGSEGSEELQYTAVHDGDLRKSHPEVEGNEAEVGFKYPGFKNS